MSRSTEDRRALLRELRIDRQGERVGVAARRGWRVPRKGLLLGAITLAAGVGLAGMHWGTAATAATGAFPEPAGRDARPETAAALAAVRPTAPPNPNPVTVLDATGYVVARRQATVNARITGKLASVLVEEGDRVRSGQVIALLDDSVVQAELALAESRLMSARSRLRELQIAIDHADRRLARSTELAKDHLVSVERLEDDRVAREALIAKLGSVQHEIEVARRQRDVREVQVAETRITAPFAGVVIDKSAHPGEVVSPMSAGFTETGIGTIVDMDSLEVEVDINEAYLNRVFPRQPARVRLNAYPSHGYDAEVIAIVPTADRNKATVRVRIGLLETDDRVLPNIGVQVGFVGAVGAERADVS